MRGGEPREERNRKKNATPCKTCNFDVLAARFTFNHLFSRPQNGDPEDLWDFGTVRSTARPATVGRAQAYKHATGEPHIWESEEDWPDGASAQAGEEVPRYANDRDLPPLPATPGKPIRFNQGTVRHAPVAATENAGNHRPIERERSGGYDDYEGAKIDGLQHQMEDAQLDDELTDTTLLDSVVLPAIASVNKLCL